MAVNDDYPPAVPIPRRPRPNVLIICAPARSEESGIDVTVHTEMDYTDPRWIALSEISPHERVGFYISVALWLAFIAVGSAFIVFFW